MQLTNQSVLRILTIALVVAVVVLGGVVAYTFIDQLNSDTPTTELERAVMSAEEAVRANPEDGAARTKLAAAYLDQGLTGAAVEQAELAISIDPADPTPQYVLGLAQLKSGDYEAAVATLDKAATSPGQVAQFYQDAYFALSQAHEGLGDQESALQALDEAINNNPDNALMVLERARYYERQEMWADALFDLTIVLTYDPGHEEALAAYETIAEAHPEAEEEAMKNIDIWWSSQSEDPIETPGR